MNRQKLVTRLADRKLRPAGNGTRNGSSGKVFRVCRASSNMVSRKTPSTSNRKG